jgi:hypothetical protein
MIIITIIDFIFNLHQVSTENILSRVWFAVDDIRKPDFLSLQESGFLSLNMISNVQFPQMVSVVSYPITVSWNRDMNKQSFRLQPTV